MKKLFLYIFSTLLLLANSHQVTAQNFSNIQQIHRQAGVAVSPVTPASVFVAGNLQSVLQRQYERRESMHIAAKKSSGASGERLKAFCGYNLLDTFASHPGKSDSAYYFYSSNRSSLFNFQKMAYLSPSVNTYTSPVDQNYPFALIYAPVQSPVISMDIMPDSVYAWNSYCPFGPSSGNIFGFADKVLNTYSGDLLTQTDNQYYLYFHQLEEVYIQKSHQLNL